jgi:hypothetical protein
MTKEQTIILNDFLKSISKADVFIPEKILPKELKLSESDDGSVAMVSILTILDKMKIMKEKMYQTQNFDELMENFN